MQCALAWILVGYGRAGSACCCGAADVTHFTFFQNADHGADHGLFTEKTAVDEKGADGEDGGHTPRPLMRVCRRSADMLRAETSLWVKSETAPQVRAVAPRAAQASQRMIMD